MIGFWDKLNQLVPEPKCRCSETEIVEWSDARPQPTQAEIEAVTKQEVDATNAEKETNDRINVSKFDRLIFEIHFDGENRLRVLEGKQPISKLNYEKALKNIYRNL